MKIYKTADGNEIKLSRSEWQSIGRTAGWDDEGWEDLDEDDQSLGWDRFKALIDVVSWDYVIEAGTGNPTEEEQKAIMDLGFYGRAITLDSIASLKGGERGAERLAVMRSGVDGNDEETFSTKEEMRAYIKERLGMDVRNVTETGFGTDYSNYSLEGATMSDLGISTSDPLGLTPKAPTDIRDREMEGSGNRDPRMGEW